MSREFEALRTCRETTIIIQRAPILDSRRRQVLQAWRGTRWLSGSTRCGASRCAKYLDEWHGVWRGGTVAPRLRRDDFDRMKWNALADTLNAMKTNWELA